MLRGLFDRVATPHLLMAFALALALPAYLLTNESFRPTEEKTHLQGRDLSWDFTVVSPEWLFLELEFTVRAPGGERTGIVLTLNDMQVASLPAERLYVTQRARILMPLDAVRARENRLRVRVDGPAAATFEANLRLHNYYGISPRFPRAFVVADQSVMHFLRQFSIPGHVVRFGAFYLLSALLLWGIGRISGRRSGAGAYVLMFSPSMLLWCVLVYGFLTPLHIWLSLEALLALGLFSCLLTACALWIPAHRVVLAKVIGATLVTLVVFEIVLRVFNHYLPSAVFYTDSYNRYRGQPNAPHFDSRLNALGFNDVSYEPSKPPHVYRVAAIGDSVAFGVVPYGANYLTLLEAELAQGGPVEVINLGVPGTEPKDYLAILVEEGLRFNPDLVMVGFFIGNDFEAAARKPYEHSHVATYFHFLWTLWSAGMPVVRHSGAGATSYHDGEPSLPSEHFLEIEVDRARIYSNADADLRRSMARAVGYLRAMRDISRRAGADILVVLIPDEVQIDEALRREVIRAHGSTGDQFDFRLPNRLLAAELSREGIPFVDLLAAFEEEGKRTGLYKPRDTHWNLAGNRLAAVTLGRFLRGHIQRSGQ